MPYAFTEQGISMLSAILRSDVAINVSIGIMRAFVEMRKFLATNFRFATKYNISPMKMFGLVGGLFFAFQLR